MISNEDKYPEGLLYTKCKQKKRSVTQDLMPKRTVLKHALGLAQAKMDVNVIRNKEEAKTLPFEQRIQTMNNQIGPGHAHQHVI